MACNPEDIEIVAGNNSPPVSWQFLDTEGPPEVLFPLDPASTFYLTIKWPGGSLRRNTEDDPDLVIDLGQAMVSWNYNIADSRAMPFGRVATYELEWRVAPMQVTYIAGGVMISGGINAD
jgi:hypothetical protein